MIKSIKSWFFRTRMTPYERYLADSIDLADLERRQRQIQYGKVRL
jgi:hypothetical protein